MFFWTTYMLQNGVSSFMINLDLFHDYEIFYLNLILCGVSGCLFMIMTNNYFSSLFIENQILETMWTLFPCIILCFLGYPSLSLLYKSEILTNESNLSLKVTGHQWYWSYEYSDLEKLNFDSFMLNEENNINMMRMIDVDNRTILPSFSSIRSLILSSDVLHSWAIPSLGIKLDANPGRLNQTNISSQMNGLFIGQCSEICGANHSFMPIVLEFISPSLFLNWAF